ncbi:unnamed protein product [Auanema sp. JU1783]|nr:unnamed protein product [Auanema sp. JU1783]
MGGCFRCLNACLQLVRWLPVAILLGALGWGYYAYVFQLCFWIVENPVQRFLYLFFFHILLALFGVSYFKTIFTNIGTPARQYYLPPEILEELEGCRDDPNLSNAVLRRYVDHVGLNLVTRSFNGGIRYCAKCKCIKPDRTHHCSICGVCVLKFDHHCPWVNTCVNFRNYKFFLLFLGYGFIFCIYVVLTDLPFFISFWKGFSGRFSSAGFQIILILFVAGMFAISLSFLFFYHLYLTARNRTTLESFHAPMVERGSVDKNAFNHGIRSNYREVFGSNWKTWLLPVYTSLGDGLKFGRWTGAVQYTQLESRLLVDATSEDSEEDVL